jgi:hemolysin D
LHIHTLGSAIQAADVLMTIVPDNSPLTVEAQILNKDVGFVHAGQRVNIKIDAFPFTEFGMLHGTLTSLSGSSVPPIPLDGVSTAAAGAPSVYLARITLDKAYLMVGRCATPSNSGKDCRKLSLSSGMTLQAEIETGRRRIITYLLSPLTNSLATAGRER